MTETDLARIEKAARRGLGASCAETLALVDEVRRLWAEARELREEVERLEAYARHLAKTADPG